MPSQSMRRSSHCRAWRCRHSPPIPPVPRRRRSDRDAVCTRCHDENDPKPILAIYQTRHGVQGRCAHAVVPVVPRRRATTIARNPRGVSPRPAARSRVRREACVDARRAKRIVPDLPQGRHAHALGGQRAPEAAICVCAELPQAHARARPGAGEGRRSPTSATPATRRSARRRTASPRTRSSPGRWRARIATTRTARPARSCWSRTPSTRPATRATPKSAARSCGNTRRSSTTARTAIRRTARPTRRC